MEMIQMKALIFWFAINQASHHKIRFSSVEPILTLPLPQVVPGPWATYSAFSKSISRGPGLLTLHFLVVPGPWATYLLGGPSSDSPITR